MSLLPPVVLVKAKSFLCHLSGGYGIVNVFEVPKPVSRTIATDYGLVEIVPSAVMNATNTRKCTLSGGDIAHIFRVGDGSKIAPPVVIPNPIDVVNFVFRLFTSNHLPYDSVAYKRTLVNADPNVPAVRSIKYWLSGKSGVPSLAGCFGFVEASFEYVRCSLFPSQNSAVLVIGKQLVQKICGGKSNVFHVGLRSGHGGERIQVREHLYPQTVYHGV